ncbi:unnamed protein product [Diplocarpon coronariae]
MDVSAQIPMIANTKAPGFGILLEALQPGFPSKLTTRPMLKLELHEIGDSYVAIGFKDAGTQPTPTNSLGDPTYSGYTSSNGPNRLDYLTAKYSSSTFLNYNLAYGGATMDSALVAPCGPQISPVGQLQKEWFPVYAGSPASAL